MHPLRKALGRLIWAVCMASPLAAVASADQQTPALQRRPLADERIVGLRESMVGSADLRLRIVYASEIVLLDDAHPEKGIRTIVRIPADVLYDQARGSTDPMVLELLLQRCAMPTDASTRCDRLDLARRWTEADTQNQRAWLWLATVQHEAGDEGNARATFLRAATASQWHERMWDIAKLVADAAPRDFTAAERFEWLNNAFGAAVANSIEPYRVLLDYCKHGGAMAAACLRIVDTAVRDAESMSALTVMPKLAARAQAPEALVEAYMQKSDAFFWTAAMDTDAMELAANGDMVAAVQRLEEIVYKSESRRAELTLIDRHISGAEAARRYVASLSPDARASRAHWLREARAAGSLNAGSTHSTTASP